MELEDLSSVAFNNQLHNRVKERKDDGDDDNHEANLVQQTFYQGLHGFVFAASGWVSAGSAVLQVTHDTAHLRLVSAAVDSWRGTTGLAQDLWTATLLTTGLYQPIAPEATGVSHEDWQLLSHTSRAMTQLQAWKQAGGNFYTADIRGPARILTVASALSYASAADAQRTLAQNPQNRWTVTLLNGQNRSTAQAMLLTTTTNTIDSSTSNSENKATPFAILAFRGTELPDDDPTRQFFPDWLRNINWELTDYETPSYQNQQGEQVAKGFLNGYLSLRTELLSTLEELARQPSTNSQHDPSLAAGQSSKVQLYVTGHSQGAALAAVSLLDLHAQENIDLCACISVAQPKVGNASFTRAVNDQRFLLDLLGNRDITGFDPVISLPPVWPAEPDAVAPPGRFWPIQVGHVTQRPVSFGEHERIVGQVQSNPIANAWLTGNAIRRSFMSAPLHWPGGRVGYLSALKE